MKRQLTTRPLAVLSLALLVSCAVADENPVTRPRARDLGIEVGKGRTGPHNAITDVPGVRVGHVTLREGGAIRTGVTAILAHGGDIFRNRVPAAFVCFNGFGKPFGTVQIRELGQIETPLLLGSTLSVPRIADAIIDYVLDRDAGGTIHSVNPVVGETNDGYLSDGRARPIRSEHVRRAIESATTGPVEEGSVGAGTGTRCLGYKGGIGTSSRRMKIAGSEFTVGVLVQTNFGGKLRILGKELPPGKEGADHEKGSCAMVVATDAPLSSRQLERLARRSFVGMARCGSRFSHGSGDYTFAFAAPQSGKDSTATSLKDQQLDPLLVAVTDATEEAIYNSLLRATTTRGRDGHRSRAIDPSRVSLLFETSVRAPPG